MQNLLLALALVFTAETAVADTPPVAEVRAEVPDPLRVSEHTLSVRVASGKTSIRQTWVVTVEDAAQLAAGFSAPRGLDGATSGGAKVVDNVVTFPRDVENGDQFRFSRTETRGRYASGTFASLEDVAVDRARVDFQISGAPLAVWTDATANVDLGSSGGQVTWRGVGGQLVWSTWPSWDAAAKAANVDVEARMVGAIQLGREVAEGLDGLSARGIVERVNQLIQTIPETGSWSRARPPYQLVQTRDANYTERALLLLNMLRIARKPAVPALLAPDIPGEGPPNTLVAPHLYTEPAVAIFNEVGPPTLIDPMSPDVTPPDVPTRLEGGRLWAFGTPPTHLAARGVYTGRAILTGQYVLAPDGSAHWNLTLTADGSAAETLRERFGPQVSEEDRNGVLQRLARVAVPKLDRFAVTASGLGKLTQPVRIQMTGYTADAMERMGPGLTGSLHPLMAPALAAWLPGRIEVVEQVAVRRPQTMLPLAIQQTQKAHSPEVLVATSMSVEGERIILDTRVARPDTSGRPTAEARAVRTLEQRAREGATLHMFPWPSPEVRAELYEGIDGFTRIEEHTLEAMAWWRAGEERRARKAMRAALEIGSVEEVAAAYVRLGSPTDERPWEALLDEATPPERMICARGMEAQGRRDLAWRKSLALANHPSAEVRLDAMLVMARTQPATQPALADDREGFLAWREPVELLAEVQALATQMMRPEAREAALTALATLYLRQGDIEKAEDALNERLALGSTPGLLALKAEVRARRGAAPDEVQRIVREAGVLDDTGAYHAARALATVGHRTAALGWTLVAARLQPDDAERWDFVVDAAFAAGDLERALEGAKRASDAAPEDSARASRHRHIASLAWDRDQAQMAARRAGEKATDIPWAEDIAKLADLAAPEERWATLRYHDDQTNNSAQALYLRGRAALQAGASAAAARDGELLLSAHEDPRGAALYFASSVGTVYGANPTRVVDEYVEQDAIARRARMEFRLLIGGDAEADLAALPDAEAETDADLMTFLSSGTSEGWLETTDPGLRVSGFGANATLGKAKGVSAVSDRSRALAILRHTGEPWLPPPLSLVYQPRERPVAITDAGQEVWALDGGVLPVYAAVDKREGLTTLGLGFTASAAVRALEASL